MNTTKITTVITLIGALAIGTSSLYAQGCCGGAKKKGVAETTQSNSKVKGKVSDAVLASYVELSSALYKDDLKAAQKAAKAIAAKEGSSSLGKHAAQLAKSSDIKSARSSFTKISEVLVPAAKGSKSYKKAHCPMANGGKGGYWLQSAADKKVNNPYYGAAMAHCGSFK